MYSYNKLYSQYKKLYSYYLKKLTIILNDYHKKKFKEENWEPIIGLYLRRFIINFLFLNKFHKKKIPKKKSYENLNFFKNYNEFVEYHNLSKINEKLNFSSKDLANSEDYRIKKINFIFDMINTIRLIFPNILVKLGVVKIFFHESYFKKKTKFFFIFKSFFLFYLLPSLKVENYVIKKDKVFYNRLHLLKKYKITNNNDHLFHNLILSMPVNYLENFEIIEKEVNKISLSSAIYVDGDEAKFDYLKFFISKLLLKRKKVFIGQHSLRSGLEDYDIYFDYTKSILSNYLTWGWRDKLKSIYPFSSIRIFSSLNKFKKLKKIDCLRNNICFILSSFSDYGDCLSDNLIENKKAEKSRIDLLKSLKKQKKFQIVLKPRKGSFLMKEKKYYKNLEILNYNSRMIEIFGNYNLLIFERISLGIVESIYLNQPVVFYYPRNLYVQKGKKYNKLLYFLKKANIFFDNKKDFIGLIKSKKNISLWWNNKKNLKNRKILLKNFAKSFDYNDFTRIKKLI